MKLKSPEFSVNAAALLSGLLLIPASLQAAQLAYEGFDYATGSLNGQTGGSGWNGGWQAVVNSGADVAAGSLVAGASSPAGIDARSTGNSCFLPNARRAGRFLDTSTNGPFGARGYRNANGDIGADGKTIYLSFMQQANGANSYYEFEFHRNDLNDGNLSSGRIGGIGNDTGTNNVNLRSGGTHTAIGVGDTAVNFYVVRIDFKAGNDDVYVYRNPTSTTDPGIGAGVPTLAKPAASDMSFDGISFGAFIGSPARTVAHDEVRIGESWADVTLPANAQPAFVNQPQTTTTTYAGGSFSINAVAGGYPLPTYQWFKGTTLLSGQTSPTLTLTNVLPGDAGAYHLVATNSQGDATTNDATLVVQTTPAGLLAYEGFDYNTGDANLDGKAGGIGWGAGWVSVDGGGANVMTGSLAAGSNAPNGFDAQSRANSAFIPNEKRSGRLVDTSPGGRLAAAGYIDANGNVGADGKTLYLSFLQQPDGTSLFYEFEFHKGNLGDPGRIGGIGNDTGAAVVNLRTPTNSPTLIGPGSTGVNFYVVRIDYKSGSDEVRIYQNPLSATEPGTPTLLKTNGGDMSFNGLSIAAFVGRTVKHDEIRLGQNWSDVVFGTSRRELTWVGDNISNNWNFSTANWNDGIAGTQFADGDPVTFSDTGSDTPAVNIPANVSTASLTVANDTKNYTLGGAGSINSSGGLVKSGTGSLTLNAPASFGAGVTMDGGSLALNSTASFGGNLTINAGETTLNGSNTFTGRLIASMGTHTLSGTNSFAGLQSTNANFTITGPTSITGTSSPVWLGNLTGANSSMTIEAGGSLTITGNLSDAWVIGRDGGSGSVIQNGGTVTYNPINHPETFIGASGAGGGTVASYDMNGGILDMSNTRLGLAIGPITSHLNQTGGTINVRNLELGSNLATGTGIYNLTGGTINIGAVGLGTSGITSFSGLYEVNLKGGTVGALADWQSPLTMKLINPVTFNTGGHHVTLSGALTDFDDTHSTAGSLVKNGAGTLTIGGFNDFTGPTTVNAGTLAGLGNQSSAVTVKAGASLSPGNGGIGNFSTHTATFESGSTLEVKIDSSSATSNQLVAFGNVSITGANVSFAEIGTGTIPAGTELLILDRAGVSLTGTFAGRPQGSSVSVGANTFTISYTNPAGIILTSTTVPNPYNTWAAANGLDGSPGKDPAFNADPENDGVANGLEWILGGNPLAQDSGSLVTVTSNATTGLTMTFTREEASLGKASLVSQWDTNLDGIWTDVPVTQAGGSQANGVTVAVNEAATPDSVTVHVPASNAAGGKLFGRLRATMP